MIAITLVIGEGTGAAISGILMTLAAIFMGIIRFWIHEVRGKVNTNTAVVLDMSAKQDDVAALAAVAAKKTVEAHTKLDSIKETAEKAAFDVDGNLTAVREELKKSMALNEAQATSILSLRDTIATLTDIVKQQRTQVRSTDLKPDAPRT